MKRIIFAALVGVLVSGPAWADETSNFVKFFSVNCVRNIVNFDALKMYAKLMKWKKVRKEIASLVGGKVDFSWGVRSEGQFFWISGGSGLTDEGRKYSGCSVLSKPQDANEVSKVLKSRFKLKLLVDEIEGFTRFQQFNASVNGLPMMMAIISADDPKVRGVTLSTLYFPR